MSVHTVSVTMTHKVLEAEALDLIHDVLLLRVDPPRPIARGEQLPASVAMPGSGEIAGSIVGIDGVLVRFEPRPVHAVTAAAQLKRRDGARVAENVVVDAMPRKREAVTADVMRIATGRNELPRRMNVIHLSDAGATLRGELDVVVERRVSMTLHLPSGSSMRLVAVVTQVVGSLVSVTFSFSVPTDQAQLADAIASTAPRATG